MADVELETLAEPTDSKKEKKKQKKRKAIDVSVEAFPDSAAAAPVVGYFPSGYDPLAAAEAAGDSGGEPPRARLFRNSRHTNRLELVVGGGGVDFVGRSYAGEAAMPQLCGYAVGVLDKETKTLKIVPIAANKIFRLEPHHAANQPAQPEQSEGLTEEGSAVTKVGHKIQDLTSLYGSKKDRDRDNKWQSFKEQRYDPSVSEGLESGKSEATIDMHAAENVTQTTARNIPPYDPSANSSEGAYLLDEIIPKGERGYLLEMLELLDSGDFVTKSYPSFVFNRVDKLRELKDDEEKKKLACILSYITHLRSFWEWQSHSRRKSRKQSQPADRPTIPHVVFQKLMQMFVDPESKVISTEKNELLIGYILVLTLFVDNFHSDPKDICRDLKMTFPMIKPYYQQLGCKFWRENPFKPPFATLPVPLKFPDMTKRKRR